MVSRRHELLPRTVLAAEVMAIIDMSFDQAGRDDIFDFVAKRKRLHGFVGK